jgi:hypothetical protein
MSQLYNIRTRRIWDFGIDCDVLQTPSWLQPVRRVRWKEYKDTLPCTIGEELLMLELCARSNTALQLPRVVHSYAVPWNIYSCFK